MIEDSALIRIIALMVFLSLMIQLGALLNRIF